MALLIISAGLLGYYAYLVNCTDAPVDDIAESTKIPIISEGDSVKPVDLPLQGPAAFEEPATPALPSPPATPARTTIRIAGTGDIMLQRRCNRSASQKSRGDENNSGYDGLFPGLAEAFADADVVMGNMEFPVMPDKRPERSLVFHGTPSALRALQRAGFDVLTGANNHTWDQGPASAASTASLCESTGMMCVGVGRTREEAESARFIEIGGLRLAFVGYTMLANSRYNSDDKHAARANGYSFEALLDQVRRARQYSDGVVVALHWGNEYRATPLSWQPGQARQLAEAGACVIFGHHPHVLERIDLIETKDGRRALVAYSLGNFLSNQGGFSVYRATRIGAILKADLEMTPAGLSVSRWESLPTWIENHDIRMEGKRVEDIHVEVVPFMIRDLEHELKITEDPAAKRALQQKIDFYKGRTEAVEKILARPKGEVHVSSDPDVDNGQIPTSIAGQ